MWCVWPMGAGPGAKTICWVGVGGVAWCGGGCDMVRCRSCCGPACVKLLGACCCWNICCGGGAYACCCMTSLRIFCGRDRVRVRARSIQNYKNSAKTISKARCTTRAERVDAEREAEVRYLDDRLIAQPCALTHLQLLAVDEHCEAAVVRQVEVAVVLELQRRLTTRHLVRGA